MKMIEFLKVTESYRFGLRLVGEQKFKLVDYHNHEYDDYEIVSIVASVICEKTDPVTNSATVQPYVNITIRKPDTK